MTKDCRNVGFFWIAQIAYLVCATIKAKLTKKLTPKGLVWGYVILVTILTLNLMVYSKWKYAMYRLFLDRQTETIDYVVNYKAMYPKIYICIQICFPRVLPAP